MVELAFGRIVVVRGQDLLRKGDPVQVIGEADPNGPKLVTGAGLVPDDPLTQLGVVAVGHHIVGAEGVAHPVTRSTFPPESIGRAVDEEPAGDGYVALAFLFQLVPVATAPVLRLHAAWRADPGHAHGEEAVAIFAIRIGKDS